MGDDQEEQGHGVGEDNIKKSNLEKSAVATGLEKSVFIPILKKGNAKECSNYHTITLISHASKVMLKIPKPGFSNT